MRIVFYPKPAPEVMAIGESLLPEGFSLDWVPASATSAEIAATLKDANYLAGFIPNLPDEAWRAATDLKLVQLLSAGYDNFPIPRARQMSLPVSTNGGANAISVAEHAIMLMMAVLRKLTVLDRTVRQGQWRPSQRGDVRYHELGSRSVGLLGFGQIGRHVAKRLRGFDCKVSYFDVRRLSPEDEAALGVSYRPLEEIITTCDVISLHLPLLPETRGVIGKDNLARMRPDAIVINTARGELVDEQALYDALKAEKIAGAGLDVLSKEPPPADLPLFSLDNVTITPHTAGPTWESWPRRFANSFANIDRVARGEKPLWVIPELADLVK